MQLSYCFRNGNNSVEASSVYVGREKKISSNFHHFAYSTKLTPVCSIMTTSSLTDFPRCETENEVDPWLPPKNF